MRRTPTPFLRARLLALYLLSLFALYGSLLAFNPKRLGRPVEILWPPLVLAVATLGAQVFQDRLSVLAERVGRVRLQVVGWISYSFVLALVVLGVMAGETGRFAVMKGVAILRVLQPFLLLFAGMGRGYLGAIANAFVLSAAAGLGGGTGAAVSIASHAAVLVFFLVADHQARKLGEYPVDPLPAAGPALRRGALLAAAMGTLLVAFFALVPPRPYAPFERAGAAAVEAFPRERVVELLANLGGVALLAGIGFYLLLRFGAGRGRDSEDQVIERVAARSRVESVPSRPASPATGEGTGWRGKIVKLFLRVAAQLARWGVPRRPDHTATEYAGGLAPAEPARELAEVFVRARYGPQDLTEEEYRRAAQAGEEVLDHYRGRR
jgi:hypothetical protein